MKTNEVQIEEKIIVGIKVRTKNQKEMNPETAQLPHIWGKFRNRGLIDKIPDKLPGSPVYGVYHSYESDLNGEYSVLAGVEVSKLNDADNEYSSVKIESGKYLVFEGKGEMPQVVMDVWEDIWNYFSSLEAPKRSYSTDFEVYTGPNNVAIYIGINRKTGFNEN